MRADVVPNAGGDPEARWFMDYRNADGSVAEMCGNGIRVFARYLVDGGYAAPGTLRIATRDGVKTVDVPEYGDVTVDMGIVRVRDDVDGCAVEVAGRELAGVAVTAGNPHVVVDVHDSVALSALGSLADPRPSGPPTHFPTAPTSSSSRRARPVSSRFGCTNAVSARPSRAAPARAPWWPPPAPGLAVDLLPTPSTCPAGA